VGTRLSQVKLTQENDVVVLTRNVKKAATIFKTQRLSRLLGRRGFWGGSHQGLLWVINLAGANRDAMGRCDEAGDQAVSMDTTTRVSDAINSSGAATSFSGAPAD
jgi:NAD dependent epimerase/dehydratase family enzyme